MKKSTQLVSRLGILTLAIESLIDTFRLGGSELSALFSCAYQHTVLRLGWLVLVWPLLVIWQSINWFWLLVDEIVFPQARNVEIRSPLFVVGPPRSGTTFIHRLLADSAPSFSTSATWEVLLAPSICQKKFFRWVLALDASHGNRLRKAVRYLEEKGFQAFSDTHPGSLSDPEEDYYYLSSMMACTGWMLAFPCWKGFTSYLPGCQEMSNAKRRQALKFYRYALQKQLYVHGVEKTLLSKNASFSSWVDLLPGEFPDARYVICMRTPVETVPSMLSTADKAMQSFFSDQKSNEMHSRLVAAMQSHYTVLHDHVPAWMAEKSFVIHHPEMKHELLRVITTLGDQFEIPFTYDFLQQVQALETTSASYQSRHTYALEDFGLDPEELEATCPMLVPSLTPLT